MDNNLYIYDISEDSHISITIDGNFNHIINGATDWVYEEEFAIVKAFWWSPNSDKIGFLKFDESNVRSFNMDIYGKIISQSLHFKYPKAGEDNSVVTAHIWDMSSGASLMYWLMSPTNTCRAPNGRMKILGSSAPWIDCKTPSTYMP